MFSVLVLAGILLGCSPTTPSSSLEYENKTIGNITIFSKLYGYVRYFHPSDQAAEANWEQVALQGVQLVSGATSTDELVDCLEYIFLPLAPTIEIFAVKDEPILNTQKSNLEDHHLYVVMWEHRGLGSDTSKPGAVFTSARLIEPITNGEIPEGFHDPREPLRVELGGGISAKIPLALFSDGEATLPQNSERREMLNPTHILTAEQKDRIAGILIAWNIFQHFYPYLDTLDVTWDEVLYDYLEDAYLVSSEIEYHQLLLQLVAQLQDGHGFISNSKYDFYFVPPILLDEVENQIAVTRVFGNATGLVNQGDVVLAVDGEPITQHIKKMSMLIPAATNQRARFMWLSGLEGSKVSLEIRTSGGEEKTIILSRDNTLNKLSEALPETVVEMEPGIFYVNLDKISGIEFNKLLPEFEKATGIIFDIRGYPKISPTILGYFIDEKVRSAQLRVPVFHHPDQQYVTYDTNYLEVRPIKPRLTKNIVFISNGQAISYAETYLSIIEYYQIGEIVGQPSAGTNGNVNQFPLPKDFGTVHWTGMEVIKQDGSQHHGVGIRPTIAVDLTIQALVDGKDEYLNTALEVIKRNQ